MKPTLLFWHRPALMQKATSDESASSCSSLSNEAAALGNRRKRAREDVASRPLRPEWLDLFDRSNGTASSEPLEVEAQDAPVGTFGAVIGGRAVRSEQSRFARSRAKAGGESQSADERPSEMNAPECATPADEEDELRAELIEKLSKRSDCDAHRLLCCLCNEQQTTLEALDAHMTKHEAETRRRYNYKIFQCALCPSCFPRIQRLMRHLVNAHSLSQRAAQTLSQQIRADAHAAPSRSTPQSPTRPKTQHVASPPRSSGPSAATSSLVPSSRMLSDLADSSTHSVSVAPATATATGNQSGHAGPPPGALLKLRTASHNSQSAPSCADRSEANSEADAEPELPAVQKFVSPSNSVIMPLDNASRSRTPPNSSGAYCFVGNSNSSGYVCTFCGQSFARLSALKNHRKLSHLMDGSPELKDIAPSSEKLCIAPASSRTSPAANRRHSSDDASGSPSPASNNNAAQNNKTGDEETEQRTKRLRGSSTADSHPGSNPVVIRFSSTRASLSPSPPNADSTDERANLSQSGGPLRATCPTEENELIFTQIGSLCDVRNLRCRQCGSRSSSIQTLRRHVATHLGIKRFHCAVCSFAAFYAAEVRHHCKLKHHSEQPPVPIALRNTSALPAAPSSALLENPVEHVAVAVAVAVAADDSSTQSSTSSPTLVPRDSPSSPTPTPASTPTPTPLIKNESVPPVTPRLTDASGRIRRFARITAVE